MGPEGYKIVREALDEAAMSEVQIEPQPTEQERPKFVSISFPSHDPGHLLNVLYEAGLTRHLTRDQRRHPETIVVLTPIPGLTTPERITFVDEAQDSYHHTLTN